MVQQTTGLKVLILPISLVIAVVAIIFFIKPSFSEMMSAKKSVQEKQSQLDSLKSQNQKLQGMKSKWNSLTDEKTLVATALPDLENVDAYVSELTAKASRSGILLTDLKVDQKSDAASSADVPPAYVCANVPVGAAPQASVPGQTQTTGSLAGASASPALPFPADCLNTVGISMKAAGSWEQILDFFKYLEDMNRISNVEKITLSTDQASAQAQPSSDLLTANISAKAFFKGKNPAGNSLLSQSLASQGNFNQKALDKMKEVIYAAYDVPAVSPSAERNIFK